MAYVENGTYSLFSVKAPIIPNYVPFDSAIEIGAKDMVCKKCFNGFQISYLFDKFKHEVCDVCYYDNKDEFPLVTKTAAKTKYVLRDADFERDTPLMFIVRTNPHNPRWGEMKLFLECQVCWFFMYGSPIGADNSGKLYSSFDRNLCYESSLYYR